MKLPCTPSLRRRLYVEVVFPLISSLEQGRFESQVLAAQQHEGSLLKYVHEGMRAARLEIS